MRFPSVLIFNEHLTAAVVQMFKVVLLWSFPPSQGSSAASGRQIWNLDTMLTILLNIVENFGLEIDKSFRSPRLSKVSSSFGADRRLRHFKLGTNPYLLERASASQLRLWPLLESTKLKQKQEGYDIYMDYMGEVIGEAGEVKSTHS